jgi:hypothetical protein
MQSVQPLNGLTKYNMTTDVSLVLLLSFGAMVSGTAGTCQVSETCPPEIRQFRFPLQEPANVRRKDVAPSPATSLVHIRDIFGLKMSELSQIFGVSRRAAYDWLEGATPRPEMTAKIYQLNTMATVFSHAGIKNVRHFIHRPILGDRTLFELLKAGENLDSATEVVRDAALLETNARRPLSRRVSETGYNDEESTPIFT